uniref:Sec-independent protein translocase protein TATA, chloroplastic n=1 Tax=Kalanchoe fedtschenkoi TaxID=63787 RepID=A0A7N0T501_KALFE
MEMSSLCFSPSFYSPSSSRPSSLLPISSSTSSFFNPNSTLFTRSSNKTRVVVSRPNKGLSCTCLFGLGVPELVVIAGVVALVFGPKKLPEVGRSIGKTVKSFQQAAKEFETELKKEPDSLSEPPPEGKPAPSSVSQEEKQEVNVNSSSSSEG